MNTLFEVANIYLHYRGGKHVGLAGLVGVIVAIIVILIWSDWIQPVVNFIGLDKAAENMGIVVDGIGGSAITAYNVIILYLFGCLAFSLLVGIGLLIYVYGSVALRSKFGGVLVGVLLFILFSPILIWFVVAQSISINKKQKKSLENTNTVARTETPKEKKKDTLTDYLIRTEEKNGKSNIISREDAIRYLHRLPYTGEYRYLIGITYSKEIALLFPRPFDTIIYGTNHNLIGITLSFEKFIPAKHDPHGVNGARNPERYYMRYEKELKRWDIEEIETFLYPEPIYDIHRYLQKFPTNTFYEKYVDMVHSHYALNKDKGYESETIPKEILSLNQ